MRSGTIVLITGLAVFLGTALPSYAASLDLSLIRAIRVTNDTISLSFKTPEKAVGQVVYMDSDSSTITLSDAEPQIDHLYTIDSLEPKRGYTFTLSATSRANVSNKYVVLLSPETIGAPGSSIVPVVQITTPQGAILSSTLAASTTPVDSPKIQSWVYALVGALLLLIWGLNRFTAAQARKERERKRDAAPSSS